MNNGTWQIIWSEEFVSNNKRLDCFHKEIIEGVGDLYEMCADTKKYKKEIPDLTDKIETALIEHMDLEIYYLKKFEIEEYLLHEVSHTKYKETIALYKKYSMPPAVRAILISEVARDYMKNHFFYFDTKDIPKINKKLCESGENS